MKKEKGFTLIELLAVIVILAIITVIAVPKILDVIEKSKKQTFTDGVKLIESGIKTQLSSNELIGEDNFTKSDDNCYLFDFDNRNDNYNKLKVKNKENYNGMIKYCDNKFIYDGVTDNQYVINTDENGIENIEKVGVPLKEYTVTFMNDSTEYSSVKIKEGNKVTFPSNPTKKGYNFKYWSEKENGSEYVSGTVTKDMILYAVYEKIAICKRATVLHTENCTSSYCSDAGYTTSGSKGTTTITYGNKGTKGTLSSGDAFDCDINGDGIYNSETERFYYISDYYNTSTKSFESDTSVLIYYNNTTKGTPDNSANSKSAYGTLANPSSAITNLPKWSNVKLKNSARHILDQLDETKTTTPFNYSGYTTRLATTQEINKACYLSFNWVKGELDNCNFLMENTGFSSSSMGTNGYWLETPRQLWDDRAFVVYSVNRDVEGSVIANAGYGVRPVIEVLKTQISY